MQYSLCALSHLDLLYYISSPKNDSALFDDGAEGSKDPCSRRLASRGLDRRISDLCESWSTYDG